MRTGPLKIATRGSPLALIQANTVRTALVAAHGATALGGQPELVVIKTSGDKITDRPLREFGGKGLFTKEIEDALLRGEVDLAVHSVKDMPTFSREGLRLGAVLPRADVRDVLVSCGGWSIAALPHGARIGTTSLRRQAQLRRLRPDLEVLDLRGNVETRLAKLAAGAFDGILLAAAGLARLGLTPAGLVPLGLEEMMPAVGQGAVGLEIRVADAGVAALLSAVNDASCLAAVEAERAFLAVLDGSCKSPIGGHAVLTGGAAEFAGIVLAPDGREAYAARRTGAIAEACQTARAVAEDILAQAPPAFLDAVLRGS